MRKLNSNAMPLRARAVGLEDAPRISTASGIRHAKFTRTIEIAVEMVIRAIKTDIAGVYLRGLQAILYGTSTGQEMRCCTTPCEWCRNKCRPRIAESGRHCHPPRR